ncbi:hypothetical protein KQX54_012734 [Cotesia glomerata]|uniref:Uncharacterized protein n=1 Tax=Cotesia glomerata TaxID=32391 RepID=A0AAV7HZC4_COTGL|nr:hypothetical protein KQX54_012734 [Cotesia glomerata]
MVKINFNESHELRLFEDGEESNFAGFITRIVGIQWVEFEYRFIFLISEGKIIRYPIYMDIALNHTSQVNIIPFTLSNDHFTSLPNLQIEIDSESEDELIRSQSEFLSPVSPTFVQSPTSDSVFTPSTPRETNTIMTESAQKSTQGSLPEGWPGMTTDEKLTTVMKSLVSLTIAVAEIPEIKTQSTALFTKLDILTDSLNKLQDENVKIRDELAKLNDKLITNANNTNQLETKLATFTEQLNTKTKTLSEEISLLKSVALINPEVSDLLPSSHSTSELLISGIPESVSLHLSPEDITTENFSKLLIPELKSDILCIREIKKKAKPSDDINNQQFSGLDHVSRHQHNLTVAVDAGMTTEETQIKQCWDSPK